MNIKDKEIAMNLACSYLQPIEGRMLDVVRDMVASQKIRMDGQLGKEMMAELQFYELDPMWLGTETEDFDDDGAEEAEIQRMLNRGIDDEEEGNDNSMLGKVLSETNVDERYWERREIMDGEQDVTDFQVVEDVKSCQVDFYRKPYAEPDDIEVADIIEHEPLIPVNYYDNDDGFWTNHIEETIERWDEHDVLNYRRWYQH